LKPNCLKMASSGPRAPFIVPKCVRSLRLSYSMYVFCAWHWNLLATATPLSRSRTLGRLYYYIIMTQCR
jgi:hypothetical protein